MRVLITSIPGRGHLHPLVPLGIAIQETGHQVLVATSRSFRGPVEAAGLTVAAAGLDWVESYPEAVFPEFVGADPGQRTELLTQVFSYFHPRAAVPDVCRLIKEWQPAVVVHGSLDHSGQLAAELNGIPWVLMRMMLVGGVFSAMLPQDPTERRILASLRNGDRSIGALRAELHLPPELPRWEGPPLAEKYLTLDLMPPSLQIFTARAASATAHPMRPDQFTPASAPAIDWSTVSARGPLIHVTLGTVFNRTPRILDTILEGLARCQCTVIVGIGDPLLTEVPANTERVIFVPWADHGELLSRCAALVTHGGWSTIMTGIMHELPMVVVPMGADQPRHAAMVRAVGLGQAITELTPGTVAAAVDEALRNPIYRLNARRIKSEILTMPAPREVVPLIDRLARDRTPLTSSDQFGCKIRPSAAKIIRSHPGR